MRVFEYVKHKVELASILLAREELRSVLSLPVLNTPEGALYQIGEVIRDRDPDRQMGKLRVYGIKAGGYGIAYIALDEQTLTPYCLKTFRNKARDQSGQLEQFQKEAETWIRVGQHPNLIHAHSVMIICGRPYILFEYAARADLRSQIRKGQIPVREALRYGIQFCRGMTYAQSKLPGFVHGDIKPNNCLIAQDGTLKIADFGQVDFEAEAPQWSNIPKANADSNSISESFDTRNGWRAGTPPYMAPEQFNLANKIDVRADVYSFGVMLFEMVTGRRPFKGKRHKECLWEHSSTLPPNPVSLNPELPHGLNELILKCLAKVPAGRPADFAEVEQELSLLLWNLFQEAVPEAKRSVPSENELINQYLSLMALNHFQEAAARFEGLITQKPDLASGWNYKGACLWALGRYQQALLCFERALLLKPQLASAWANKAKTLAALGDNETTLKYLEQALALEGPTALVLKLKAQALFRLGRISESVKTFRQALAIDPRDSETCNNLGLALARLGKVKPAVRAFRRATFLNPRFSEAHNNLGNALFQRRQWPEAVESYRQARALGLPEAGPSLAKACRQFYSSSRQFVSDSYTERLIEFVLSEQSDPEGAVTSAMSFLLESNFDSKVFLLCADTLCRALDSTSQIPKDNLKAMLRLVGAQTLKYERHRWAFYWLGKVNYLLRQYDECLNLFRQSLAKFGPDDKALYFVAACLEIKGQREQALKYYKKALRLDPHCPLTAAAVKRLRTKVASTAATPWKHKLPARVVKNLRERLSAPARFCNAR